jgi:hypothetical protein
MCDRGAGRSLAAVSSIHARPLLMFVYVARPDTSVQVWALVPTEAPPEVVAQVPRMMRIAHDAARADTTAAEDRR